MSTPEEAYAGAVAFAQARLDQAKAEAAEEAKWAAKRKVKVTAVKVHSSDPNSKKFNHYVVPVHGKLAHGDSVVLELTEREIHNMKMDPFVQVADTFKDEDTQADKAKVEASVEKTVIVPDAPESSPGVVQSVKESLSELRASKKKDRG